MPLPGKWAFAADEDYRVIFRRADRVREVSPYVLGSVVVLGVTLAMILKEPATQGAWIVAIGIDLVLIGTLWFVRHLFRSGPFIVDGSERRLFFPGGNDLEFRALTGLRLDRRGDQACLVLVLNTEELPLGWRPAAEAEKSAKAVSRLTQMRVAGP